MMMSLGTLGKLTVEEEDLRKQEEFIADFC
jgi:hypothetical protein